MTDQREVVARVGKSEVFRVAGEMTAFFYVAGMAVDADGAYRAYHPESTKGLDNLGNAGRPGNWWALVTDTGEPSGTPMVQKVTDPAPGFYISMTSLQDVGKARTDPTRYVDSESIPYIVLPSNGRFGANKGDLAMAIRLADESCCGAVFADVGPRNKIGEGSIALAEALGIPGSPRHGGADHGVAYIVFVGSGVGWPLAPEEVKERGKARFAEWGGMNRLRPLLP